MPPYLAGRHKEVDEFVSLLQQEVILSNFILTGLRGVGKTVLLDTLKPLAIQKGWAWVGTDLSESTSISEDRLALRLLTDLSVVTSSMVWSSRDVTRIGFQPRKAQENVVLSYDTLVWHYEQTPGLASDKLKATLELVWTCLAREKKRGLIFAYDEAQNLSDQAAEKEYPLSLLLDVFQSIQRKQLPLMLVLAGLPTLFPKLVEARTFAERMFRVVFLDRLSDQDGRDAILKPIANTRCPVRLDEGTIRSILDDSGGYPYFIQFMGREVFDALLQAATGGKPGGRVFVRQILHKLDTDFFAGRWARATDRQRELLIVIAHLKNSDAEFAVQEVVEESRQRLTKPFSPSHVSQMLVTLGEAGLVYKNRHGKYSFAVPLMGRFIRRQVDDPQRPR
jgi:hypothetical protein